MIIVILILAILIIILFNDNTSNATYNYKYDLANNSCAYLACLTSDAATLHTRHVEQQHNKLTKQQDNQLNKQHNKHNNTQSTQQSSKQATHNQSHVQLNTGNNTCCTRRGMLSSEAYSTSRSDHAIRLDAPSN